MSENNLKKRGASWDFRMFRLQNSLETLDLFKQPLPQFNMHGRTKIPTITGAIMSFIIVNVMLLYSLTKFS